MLRQVLSAAGRCFGLIVVIALLLSGFTVQAVLAETPAEEEAAVSAEPVLPRFIPRAGVGLFWPGVQVLDGLASYYGKTMRFRGKKTASGERFDHTELTAASNRFPLGTWLAVRRVDTGQCTVVRVNDRMHPRHKKRVVDLSLAAAQKLDMLVKGVVTVQVWPLMAKPEGQPGCAEMLAFAEQSGPEIARN